jgi:hypothetical protein
VRALLQYYQHNIFFIFKSVCRIINCVDAVYISYTYENVPTKNPICAGPKTTITFDFDSENVLQSNAQSSIINGD